MTSFSPVRVGLEVLGILLVLFMLIIAALFFHSILRLIVWIKQIYVNRCLTLPDKITCWLHPYSYADSLFNNTSDVNLCCILSNSFLEEFYVARIEVQNHILAYSMNKSQRSATCDHGKHSKNAECLRGCRADKDKCWQVSSLCVLSSTVVCPLNPKLLTYRWSSWCLRLDCCWIQSQEQDNPKARGQYGYRHNVFSMYHGIA